MFLGASSLAVLQLGYRVLFKTSADVDEEAEEEGLGRYHDREEAW
jgi:hypothetical protein